VRLRLHDEETGEYAEEVLRLVPAAQDPQRAHAYVQAWVRSLPSLLACVRDRTGGRSITPGMLGFTRVALERSHARTTADFIEQLTRPATVRDWAAAAAAADAGQWIRDVCQDLGLAEHADALVALRRTGIELTSPPDGVDTSRSRLGGLPDLPPDASWPHRGARPMTFLAQIDLAEMSACDDDRLLPAAGLLQIFADLTGDDAWNDTAHGPGVRVMLQPPEAGGTAATAPPAGAGTFPPRPVVPSADLSLPPLDSPFYHGRTEPGLTGGDPVHPSGEFAAFVAFLNEFHPPLSEDDRPRHRLLGYADPLQDDPWRHCAAAEPGTPPARWQLLIQIDSEPAAPLGDNGLVYVFVPRDALAAGDFSRARGVWQTH
jgi:uncharacterized protein DUF1963